MAAASFDAVAKIAVAIGVAIGAAVGSLAGSAHIDARLANIEADVRALKCNAGFSLPDCPPRPGAQK